MPVDPARIRRVVFDYPHSVQAFLPPKTRAFALKTHMSGEFGSVTVYCIWRQKDHTDVLCYGVETISQMEVVPYEGRHSSGA